MATYTEAEYIKKRTLAGHSGGKNTDVVFVDNDTLISGGSNGKRIIAWNIKTGMQLWKQEKTQGDVLNVAVPLHDPTIFVYNDGNYIIKVCSTKTGEIQSELGGELEEYKHTPVNPAKDHEIFDFVFKPKSHILAIGRNDGTVRFWNADNQQLIRTLRAHISVPRRTSLTWGPYGQIIATGYGDGTIELVNLDSGSFDNPTQSFFHDKTDTIRYGSRFRGWIGLDSLRDFGVTALAFGHSRRILATGHGDGNIILWNVATQRKFCTLLGHTTRGTDHEWSPEIKTLAWSPDGTHLASAQSLSRNIRLWKTNTGENFGILRVDTHVSSIAFSPDGLTLASGDTNSGAVTIWERAN